MPAPVPVGGATFQWTGDGANNSAATAANWAQNAVPHDGDILVFPGNLGPNSNKDALFDANSVAHPAQIQVLAAYTGTLTVGRNMAIDTLTMQSATLSVNAGQEVDAQATDMSGAAVLAGDGAFEVRGSNAPSLTISGVTGLSVATLGVDPNATWNIQADVTFLSPVNLTQAGNVYWTAGRIDTGNGGVITNLGTIHARGDNGFAGMATLVNLGTFRKEMSAGTTTVDLPIANDATAAGVFVDTGTVDFDGLTSSTNAGPMQVGPGANLKLSGTTWNITGAASFSGGGQVTVRTSSLVVQQGASLTSSVPGLTLEVGGYLKGAGPVSVTGGLVWDGGGFQEASAVTLSGPVDITGTDEPEVTDSTVVLTGSTTWYGGNIVMNQGTIQNQGTFDLQSDNTIDQPMMPQGPSSFQNQAGGTVKKTAGTAGTTFNVPVQTEGTLQFNGLTLDFEKGLVQTGTAQTDLADGVLELGPGTIYALNGGSLSGGGAISGDVTVAGGTITIAPSQTLNVQGNLTEQAGGTVEIQASGDNAWGLLGVTGTASLAGTLQITLQGYNPMAGFSKKVIEAGGATDGGLVPPQGWSATVNATDVTVTKL